MSMAKTIGGVGIAAVTGIAAYWLYGKSRKKVPSGARGWMLKMKGDVLERLEGVKELNRETYHQVVDQVAAHYRNVKNTGEEELKSLAKELKDDWSEFGRKLASGKN